MGAVETGSESVETVRRQLKGSWNLVALQLFSASGESTIANASGRLQYDEYGNMSMQANVTGAPAGFEAAALNISGRIAIDPVAREFQFQDVSARTPEERQIDPRLDASRRRHYELTGDVLKTTVRNASGAPVAVATWKKAE